MNPRSAPGDKTRDRGFLIFRLKKLDKRLPGSESHNARPIRVGERYFAQTEDIAKEWKRIRERLYGDPNV